ncbi:MAG: hypothetical protein NTV34_06685, partial [Proteobacteria bacterium]|nr:hypothetical protein [Pseudomonadota bacterium]
HVGDRITFLKMGLQTKSFDNAASQSPEHEPVSESYQRFQQLTASGGIRWQIDSAQYLEASTGPLYQTTDPYESEESRAFGALSNIFWQMRSAHEANFRIQFGSTATKAGDKTFQISTTASRLF